MVGSMGRLLNTPSLRAWFELVFGEGSHLPSSSPQDFAKVQYLSNAPAETPLQALVQVSGLRWPIERAFQDCKDELGMDHYETRTWRGWHHHQTLVILAHHFLVQLQGRLKKRPVDRLAGPEAAGRRPASSHPRSHQRDRTAASRPMAKLRGVSVAP